MNNAETPIKDERQKRTVSCSSRNTHMSSPLLLLLAVLPVCSGNLFSSCNTCLQTCYGGCKSGSCDCQRTCALPCGTPAPVAPAITTVTSYRPAGNGKPELFVQNSCTTCIQSCQANCKSYNCNCQQSCSSMCGATQVAQNPCSSCMQSCQTSCKSCDCQRSCANVCGEVHVNTCTSCLQSLSHAIPAYKPVKQAVNRTKPAIASSHVPMSAKETLWYHNRLHPCLCNLHLFPPFRLLLSSPLCISLNSFSHLVKNNASESVAASAGPLECVWTPAKLHVEHSAARFNSTPAKARAKTSAEVFARHGPA
nr:CBN-PQN-95 protein [Haemonchus contortus]